MRNRSKIKPSQWLCISALILLAFGAIIVARVQIPQKKLEELISKALIETIAQKQRDLLEDDFLEMMSDQDPEVQPGFFEGDMAGMDTDELARLGLNFGKYPRRQWPNHTVPYMISPLYLPDEFMILQTAIRILSFYTCVKFREWDGKEPDYLVIWPVQKPAGCWSYVGKLGGPQIVSLQAPDLKSAQCFAGIGRPLHEIMHALGVFHEQSRPDRDAYVTIEKKNVLKGFLNNFDKLDIKNATMHYEYDYKSIMHYGMNFFSKNRREATLVPKQKLRGGGPVPIGQRINLSRLDCMKLNSLYGCFDISPFHKRKYTTFCEFLGL